MYVRSPTPVVEPSRVGPTGEARQALERRRRIGGQWFYWIAGLSLVNAAIGFTGADWRFILGLGVTQIVQELAKSGSNGTTAGLVGLAVIAIFTVLGQRAVLGHGWAFVLGMTLYALDGGIFVLGERRFPCLRAHHDHARLPGLAAADGARSVTAPSA